jgi:hypothetical protein
MSQKIALYCRHEEARENPKEIADLHLDGMTRTHSMFPSVGQDYTFPKPLGHKMEGLINHNRRQHILHTFQNVKSGTNIAIHLVLLELEWMYDNHDLPPTIFLQIDGGSENTSRAFIILCELLIARRLCKHLYLTRLVASHGYEDIDAWFGNISKLTRTKHIATMKRFQELISKCSTLLCEYDEAFVIPDYKLKLDQLMGSGFKNYSKGPEAIHQWWFQAVDVCDDFPFGVKTMGRHYCGESYTVIIKDESKLCNLNFQTKKCEWMPLAKDTGRQVDGTYFLRDWPTPLLRPSPFRHNSHVAFMETYHCAHEMFNSEEYRQWWDNWMATKVPQTDNVFEYISHHPLAWKVPLYDKIFNTSEANVF